MGYFLMGLAIGYVVAGAIAHLTHGNTKQEGLNNVQDTTKIKIMKINDYAYRYLCERCGNEATPQDKFCRGCGRKIIQ